MDVSIVILNYKQKGLVKQCVKGIIGAEPHLDYEIIVVDNGSGDGCLETINQLALELQQRPALPTLFEQAHRPLPPIITIAAGRNGGYAFGNNIGIKQARGEYVLILNPDIAIVPGVIEAMADYLRQHQHVGIVGPRLIYPDGSIQDSCRRFPKLLTPILRRSLFGKLPQAKQALDQYVMNDFDHQRTVSVDWLFGAALLVRKTVFDQIGLFDERFFLYFEDLDLCRRSWQAGFAVHYLAKVEIVHYHQRQSAEKTGVRGLFDPVGRIHLQSGFKYFAKYWGVDLPKRDAI